MPSVYLKTFGCQMNEQDSVVMTSLLEKKGYQLTTRSEEADLVLINTCSIREKAYQKGMSEIGRHSLKEGGILGVTGCVASEKGARLLKRYPQVDFVLGTDQIGNLPRAIEEVRDHRRRIDWSGFQDISDYEFPTPLEGGSTRKVKAFVTIMKGCDNACSFCIVPLTRGAEVSRRPEEIIAEIHGLERDGVREVMLLGQNVNSYGKRFKFGFPKLLRKIDEECRVDRIRFTSPHPKDLSPALVEEYRIHSKLCPHIHLPVQSGSDSVLKRMRRAYTRKTYLRRVEAIRKACPEVAITTDLIVGFPGESEKEFCETLSLVEEVRFDQSYSFAYSVRPGTEAAGMKDALPLVEKKARLARLQKLQEEMSLAKNRESVGRIEKVLVEGASLAGGKQLTGRTGQGRIVNFDGRPDQIGAILDVKISEAFAYSLRGEAVC